MKITKKVITEKEECLDVIVKKELDLYLLKIYINVVFNDERDELLSKKD